jgi:hypothetical protein
MIFCSSDLSAGEIGASSVVLSSGSSLAPTPVFGLPLGIGSVLVREILSTCHYKKIAFSENVMNTP